MKLVEKIRDMSGVLSVANQQLIEQMLDQPTLETWQQARHVIISPAPVLTLDMAINRIAGKRDNRIPSPFTVYRALDYALKKREHYLRKPSSQSSEAM